MTTKLVTGDNYSNVHYTQLERVQNTDLLLISLKEFLCNQQEKDTKLKKN